MFEHELLINSMEQNKRINEQLIARFRSDLEKDLHKSLKYRYLGNIDAMERENANIDNYLRSLRRDKVV